MYGGALKEHSVSRPGVRKTRHTLKSWRFLVVLMPATLLSLCLEPWGLQASSRQDLLPQAFETTLEIVAVGDIMMHLSQVKSAYNRKTEQFDFSRQFAAISDRIRAADIAIGNLETTFTPGRKVSGYPRFNTPSELARDLREAGFDLMVTANNHALDFGEKGVLGTLDALQKYDMRAVGTHRSPNAAAQPVIIEKNGIKVAFLAYTCGTNGLQRPAGKPYLLNLYSTAQVEKDVASARAQSVDLILCYMHFGAEYDRFPDQQQYRIDAALRKAGVHVVLGSHPHVIQPENRRLGEKQYTLFSLGNFISGQKRSFTDVGLLLTLRVRKAHPGGIASIERVSYTPTHVERSQKGEGLDYRVVPLLQVDAELSEQYRNNLTYNRTSLNSDLLGHIRGGVFLDVPEPEKF